MINAQEVDLAILVAQRTGVPQGEVQSIISLCYDLLMITSAVLFISTGSNMGFEVLMPGTAFSGANVASVCLTFGTGVWALGSWFATQDNRLSVIITGSQFTTKSVETWQERLSKAVIVLVLIGLSLFVAGVGALFTL